MSESQGIETFHKERSLGVCATSETDTRAGEEQIRVFICKQ